MSFFTFADKIKKERTFFGRSGVGSVTPTDACTEVIRAKHHTIVVKTHSGSEATRFFTHRLERKHHHIYN